MCPDNARGTPRAHRGCPTVEDRRIALQIRLVRVTYSHQAPLLPEDALGRFRERALAPLDKCDAASLSDELRAELATARRAVSANP